jgi:hypothetical protein
MDIYLLKHKALEKPKEKKNPNKKLLLEVSNNARDTCFGKVYGSIPGFKKYMYRLLPGLTPNNNYILRFKCLTWAPVKQYCESFLPHCLSL